MEITSLSLCAHDDKENVSPSASAAKPSAGNGSSAKCKRRLRKPLRDITHLFVSVSQTHPTPNPSPISSLGKRKAAESFDSVQQANSSRLLRMNFR
ncbi:hypothetical protein NMG60_11019253 [Bertholletia excelsa]